ncbi:hypothetical protein PPSIR1_25891 [Plesiocystis pacifica SIR-1]|uniref:Uncharacterized protein n=1 Tax=Plesiocystis pacifica SIR-1 TaxID=391625 RepID=A6FZJ2_9BACT|nr:MYXO-CTERM sorting domain-containing protein [Plesiocystis pacifica]EDM81076.1 hypothetical protein PPSIR1_25891 [Plesiocystis pacifica SIR-1]
MTLSRRAGLLALTLTAGVGAGLAPASAEALSCAGEHGEELELELQTIERDGEAVALELADEVPGTWAFRLIPGSGGSLTLNDEGYGRWTYFDLDTAIDPTPEVANYIEASEARRTSGRVCGGIPFVAAKPGVYALDELDSVGELEGGLEMPEGTVLTLDAAREVVTVEFETEAGAHVLSYEVVDFYFPEDRDSGCSVTSSPSGPAGLAWSLGLLALVGWRRRARA